MTIEASGGSGVGWDVILGIDGGGNIDERSFFIPGPLGDYYLSQISWPRIR